MLCPKCKQTAADGARFCGSCGEALNAAGNPDATLIRPPRGPVGGARPSTGGEYSTGGAAPGGSSPAWAAVLGAAAPGLMERIKNIILTPKTEWPVIEIEPTTISQLYKGYVVPLAAFSALMSFMRMSVIGIRFFRVPVLTGLAFVLVNFIFGLLGLYAIGWIIDMLAPTFTGQRDRRQAVKTAAYAFTPAAVGSVFGLLGLGLGTLLQLAAAVWGIYLLYLGLPVLMRSPREKSAGYTAAVIVCAILLFIVFGIIASVFNPMRSHSPFAMNGTAMTRQYAVLADFPKLDALRDAGVNSQQ